MFLDNKMAEQINMSGTDGARLSFMGLPCPNLGTGGHGFHGPFEHITAEGMDAVVAMLHAIAARYTV